MKTINRPTGLAFFWMVFLAGDLACGETASSSPLADYVAKPDSSYAWQKHRDGKVGKTEYAELILTSQTWRGIAWRHQLFVIKPSSCQADTSHALLFITGGSWKDELARPAANDELPRDARQFTSLAEKLGTPVAVLMQVPHQPLFDDRYEDEIIAYTFDKFHETGDVGWPLLLPMVKSAVRGMDATIAFSQQQWSHEIKSFTVSGASKRGWTTWLTGAVDRRAAAIAPMVIDVLNMGEHLKHQKNVWGGFSQQINDYTRLKLQDKIETERGKQLHAIVDPYSYREKLIQPKLIMIGTNDRYWPIDALDLYWNDLAGEKYVLYVPNAGHSLKDLRRVMGSLNALHRRAAHNAALPQLAWQFAGEPASGEAKLVMQSDVTPAKVQFWTANAATRDFRDARWSASECAAKDNCYTYPIKQPARGFTAVFGEAVYDGTSMPFFLSTTVKIVSAAADPALSSD